MNDLSPLALVSPQSALGSGVAVGPFVVIEPGVVVGDGCVIEAGAVIRSGTKLGSGVRVHPHAVIGGPPQDYAFDPATPTGVSVGAGTVIREGVTISRATKPDGDTRVGANCMLMAFSHVAHDAVVGDHVTIANAALIAGHVTVGDRAFISGGAAIHQFNRVGDGAMVSGNSRITLDVPPYVIASERNEVTGLNLVGLRRRGFSREIISELKRAYREVYGVPSMNHATNAAAALASGAYLTEPGIEFLRFIAEPGRRHGYVRPREGAFAGVDV